MDWISTVTAERVAAEEAGLMALVASGDRDEPLVELYRRYARRVYGLGLHLLRDAGWPRTSCRRPSCAFGAPRRASTPGGAR
jgi:hypothetical protein